MKKRKASPSTAETMTLFKTTAKASKPGNPLPPFLSHSASLKELVKYVEGNLADPRVDVSADAPAFFIHPTALAFFASFLSQASQESVDMFPRYRYQPQRGKAKAAADEAVRTKARGDDVTDNTGSRTESIHEPRGANAVVLRADIADKGAQISAGIPIVSAPSGKVGHVSGKSSTVQQKTADVAWVVPWEEWSERKYSGNHHAVINAASYLSVLKFFRPFEHLCCVLVLDVERCKVAILFVPQKWRDALSPDVATLGLLHPEEGKESFANDNATGSLLCGDIAPPQMDEENENDDEGEEEEEEEAIDPKLVNDSYFPFKFDVNRAELLKKLIPQHFMTVSVNQQEMQGGKNGEKNGKWSFRLKLKPTANSVDMALFRSVSIDEALICQPALMKETSDTRHRLRYTESLLFSRPVVEVLLKYLSECEKLQLPSTVQVHFDPDMFMLVGVRTKYFYFIMFAGSMEEPS
jgi:hypothetical protein